MLPLKFTILIAWLMNEFCDSYTLSGRIGKVVALHDAVARSIPLRCTDLYYARGAQGVLPMRVGVRPVNWIYPLWRYCP